MRREELARKSEEKAVDTTRTLTGTSAKEEAAAAERAADVRNMRDAPNPLTNQTTDQLASSTFAPSGSTRVIEDTKAARAGNDKFLDQQDKTRAALGAFGDVMVGNNQHVQRNAQDLRHIGNAYQNWNQFVLPAQLESANQSGRHFKTLADVLQVVSAVYGAGGLMAGAPAGAVKTGADAAWNSPHLFEMSKAVAPNFLQGAGAAAPGAAYDSSRLFESILSSGGGGNPYSFSGKPLYELARTPRY
jgi:hypothetical protein